MKVSTMSATTVGMVVVVALLQVVAAYPEPSSRMMFEQQNERPQYLRNQILAKLRSLEAALIRQGAASRHAPLPASPAKPAQSSSYEPGMLEMSMGEQQQAPRDDELASSSSEEMEGSDERGNRLRYGYGSGMPSMENLRRMRRNFRKRNYNLDHLARMNFRRSFRAASFNNRHILGGL